jgi:hypothetical protein
MQDACLASAAANQPTDSFNSSQTHQPFIKEPIVNARRFALTNLRPAAGRGAAVRGGCPMGLAMNGQILDCCNTDPHLPVSPASLWLEGNEDQMHPGEGSA